MEYRNWTKKDGIGRDISTSLLGYGCMRFPTNADGTIDVSDAMMVCQYYLGNITKFPVEQ